MEGWRCDVSMQAVKLAERTGGWTYRDSLIIGKEPKQAHGEPLRLLQNLLPPLPTRCRPVIIHAQQIRRKNSLRPNEICLAIRYAAQARRILFPTGLDRSTVQFVVRRIVPFWFYEGRFVALNIC
jgi:hypothetical protein